MTAWPWTVTSGKDGRFFDSKAAALAHVKKLQARGIKNIDVGCMQINLHYHGHRFRSISEAFDPDINTAYAASYLRKMHQETNQWILAAGHYHSKTPTKASYYRGKVERYWAELNGTQIEAVSLPAPVVPV